jgi:hypothetical protein
MVCAWAELRPAREITAKPDLIIIPLLWSGNGGLFGSTELDRIKANCTKSGRLYQGAGASSMSSLVGSAAYALLRHS